jgi:hypothetical protein
MLMLGVLGVCGYCELALQCVLYPADWVCDVLVSTTMIIHTSNLSQGSVNGLFRDGNGEDRLTVLKIRKKL